VDGQKTLLELAQAVKLTEFDVTKVAYRLLEGGYISLSERPGRPGAAPAPQGRAKPGAAQVPEAAKRVVRIFVQIFQEIFSALNPLNRADEFLSAANAALAGQAKSDAPVLDGVTLGPDGTLDEATLLQRYTSLGAALGPEPIAALRRALSDAMFFLLFQAGDMLDPKADEALNKRVKELLGGLEG
jgi:hypothetical protein